MPEYTAVLVTNLEADSPSDAAILAHTLARQGAVWRIFAGDDKSAPHHLPDGLGDYMDDGSEAD